MTLLTSTFLIVFSLLSVVTTSMFQYVGKEVLVFIVYVKKFYIEIFSSVNNCPESKKEISKKMSI